MPDRHRSGLHPRGSDAIRVSEDEIAGNGIDDAGNGYVDDVYGWNFHDGDNRICSSADEDSYGTHGAGTMAAFADNGVGIAGIGNSGNAQIMVLRALGTGTAAGPPHPSSRQSGMQKPAVRPSAT